MKTVKFILFFSLILLFFSEGVLAQQRICGAFQAVEGQVGFIDEILFNDDGRSIIVNKKTARKITGKYHIKQGVLLIETTSMSKMFFKFETKNIIVGKGNKIVVGLRFSRNEQASAYCLKENNSQSSTSSKTTSAIAPSENFSQEEGDRKAMELCGYYESTTPKKSFYLSLLFNKDETLVFTSRKKKKRI